MRTSEASTYHKDRDYHVLTNLEHCKGIKTIEFCLGEQWGKSMVLIIK